MALVSMATFGEMHGATKQAVSKWKAKGALKIVDGKIDVEASDRLMLHHGLGRFAEPSTKASTGAQTVNRQPSTTMTASTGLAQEISDLASDVGDEFASLPGLQRFVAVIAAGGYSNAVEAETVKQNALALKHLLDARVKANELCDIADAETALFESARASRDVWMGFADRVGPTMAAELGIEPEKLVEALTVHVHQQLAEMGEPENPFGEAGSPGAGFAARVHAAAEDERAGLGGRISEARQAGGEQPGEVEN
ncbi:MAG: hypothetical protein DI624_04045 [Brevundimonas sp.]|uniref:hypothetical protein n=1 Tax=Brevundimonas sp. TaxID=1871086 RepID=UPI000DB24AE9|nr:hypothetical protein [Brevundimonas sp.]PZT99851.1 MAG: hypothetical protein DI624_04045 [Brevundimonas sp.]